MTKSSIRRIAIASSALLVLAILYFFPATQTKDEDNFIQELVYTTDIDKSSIYLIDQNDYVARTSIAINSTETTKIISQMIETLTINGKRQDYIPNGFKPIIPEGTILLNQDLDSNGLLKLDFSKEILTVTKDNEEKMIEAIVYSLTSLNEVKKVMIFVEGKQLFELPHSKRLLPNGIDRNFGINKVYDLDKLKDSTKTTIYYIGKYNSTYYYVPITKIDNSTAVSKVEIIINELKSSPIYQTNLMSYLATNAELLDYEVLENKVSLSFNKYLLDSFDDNKILEEVKYTIALSILDNYNVNEVVFNVDDKEVLTMSVANLD